jgi:hypothetical protein
MRSAAAWNIPERLVLCKAIPGNLSALTLTVRYQIQWETPWGLGDYTLLSMARLFASPHSTLTTTSHQSPVFSPQAAPLCLAIFLSL